MTEPQGDDGMRRQRAAYERRRGDEDSRDAPGRGGAIAPPDAEASETTPCRIEPVKAQGNVSTDGVFIRMRGEG
ncbi:MAG: hypothetical protein ACK4WM_08170, partial [Thermoflexales bacterium]